MANGETRTIADRYILEELIAHGGMASVWRARDDVLARTVAVKLLQDQLATDQTFVARFRQEAVAAARLTHPNIVAIYDTGAAVGGESDHFIVMEYCAGGTLEDVLQDGRVPHDRAVAVAATICDALGYAHDSGVVHRDVKPGNVLISDHGVLKVADFGIAKAAFAGADLTTTGSIVGTVTYISPEQAQGEDPGPAADLYSLGVVLFQMLTGRPPFRGETEIATALAHVREPAPTARSFNAAVPRSLDAVVQKAMEKDPARRFRSAAEMKQALLEAGGSGATRTMRVPVTPPRARAAPPENEPRSGFVSEGKRLVPVVLLIVAAAIAAVVLASAAGNQEQPDEGRNDGSPSAPADAGGATGVEIASATDFDPHGGDGEHPDDVGLAHDGDPGSSWNSSSYSDQLSLIKPGVGLLFDLGEPAAVARVEIELDQGGYQLELRAADETGADEDAFDQVASTTSSEQTHVFEPDTEARYWLVWFTGFPGGGGGRATVNEVRFFGD